MSDPLSTNPASVAFDAIIIRAGICGLYQLHRLREIGLSVRVYFSVQPETLRYLELAADRLDLRRDVQFNTRMVSAVSTTRGPNRWTVTAEDGSKACAKYLGYCRRRVVCAPYTTHSGRDDFQGAIWHTAQRPHQPIDLCDKRVEVLGSGTTGVQPITEIAKTAGQLTVFQRTANYCVSHIMTDEAANATIAEFV